ncbi:hypothetical protein SELMODRAFT_404507 [Selaginella moellendorffii]|uniref:RING-type domain-containing protein n=2 Tax=Selaginella moellendorffii TaxID=88036 RepID=D8QVJ9_SELML|nr:hypothetical protein SELMODRAFT_404507 [Selaginella moellendorffii]
MYTLGKPQSLCLLVTSHRTRFPWYSSEHVDTTTLTASSSYLHETRDHKYANRRFYLTSRAAELDGIVAAEDAFVSQVTHRCSETEMVLKILLAYMKAETSKPQRSISSTLNEYAAARRLTTAQQLVLTALDELSMSTTRLCLQGAKAADGNPFGDEGYEIAIRNAELTNEKFVAVENLSRVKRQLRYLKGVRNKKDEGHNSLEGETCPVCHDSLESGAMVLPCGHLLCGKCLNLIVDCHKAPAIGADFKRIACPTRQQTYVSNIAYANAEAASSKIAENLQEEEEDEETSITVAGSYGTKIEAVVRRIFSLKEDDPFVKIFVFSTWQEVLDLLEHALKSTSSAGQMGSSILEFKKENIQVMLLPIQHGANGLNLIEAQHVILVEPLLNPAVEAQAINRVHRIGQRLKTLVHRFIICNTVEENIYKMSQQKTNLLPMKQKEQPLSANDMNSLLAWDEPKENTPTASEMGAKFQPLPRFYWTKEQIAAIRDLCRDDDLYVKTKYGRKMRPPPLPRLSREQERFVRADPQAGLDRISGQWVALQHQLGKQPYTPEEQEGNYVGSILGHKQYRRELHLHRGQKQWNVHAVGDRSTLAWLPSKASNSEPLSRLTFDGSDPFKMYSFDLNKLTAQIYTVNGEDKIGEEENCEKIFQALVCTPNELVLVLRGHASKLLEMKKVVVIGCSDVVGLPRVLLQRHNATVTIYAHAKTRNANLVRRNWIKPGLVVIDMRMSQVKEDHVLGMSLNATSAEAAYPLEELVKAA